MEENETPGTPDAAQETATSPARVVARPRDDRRHRSHVAIYVNPDGVRKAVNLNNPAAVVQAKADGLVPLR